MLTNLITNIQKLSKDGKESYFGKRWSAEAGLKKTVDRVDYTFDEVEKTSPAKQLNEQILSSYQQTPDTESKRFVSRITDESLSFLAKRRGLRLQQMHAMARCNESMAILISRIFDRLEAYSWEVNASLGCTEMQTAITRPAYVREVTRFSKARQPLETITYYRARVASPSWSLVIRGKNGKIEAFLLPVQRVMGLSKTEDMYEPLFEMNATCINEDGAVEWDFDGKPLTELRELELSMEMFVRLIETTKDHLASEVYFDHDMTEYGI